MIHTKYESLTDEQLADLFHSSNWNNNMTPEDRLAACQEVVNRDALSQGMTPCEVVADDLRGTEFGYYANGDGRIHVNGNILSSGQIVDEDGNATAYPGSNAETLNTLFHENRHAYDAQLSEAIEDKMAGNAYNHAIIEDAEARGLDIDQIRASDTIYVQSDDGYDLYRVQSSEREAFKAGEEGCARMFEGSQSRLGADGEYQAYSDRLAAQDGYKEAMDNLKSVYNDENFDKTLDEQAKNLYFSDHKKDSEFVHGTPESRSAAKGIVEDTKGAMAVGMNSRLGYTNEHYDGNANAANATGVNNANASGAKAAVGAATGDHAATGDENAAVSASASASASETAHGAQAGQRSGGDAGESKGAGANSSSSALGDDDSSVGGAGTASGGSSSLSDEGSDSNSDSGGDEDADS